MQSRMHGMRLDLLAEPAARRSEIQLSSPRCTVLVRWCAGTLSEPHVVYLRLALLSQRRFRGPKALGDGLLLVSPVVRAARSQRKLVKVGCNVMRNTETVGEEVPASGEPAGGRCSGSAQV